jgi:hypothetical protein
VTPDSQVGWCGPSTLFYKVEAFAKQMLLVPAESRQVFHPRADQQNAAVGAL